MADRKARLAALAAKAGRSKPQITEDKEQTQITDQPEEQPEAKRQKIDDVDVSNEQPRPVEDEQPEPEVDPLEQALEEAKREATLTSSTDANNTIGNLAPKKINWDLRRDVQARLDKLERKTQRVMIEILKARLDKEAAAEVDDLD